MKWKCKTDVVLFGKILATAGDIVSEGQTLTNGNIAISIDSEMLSDEEVFEKIQHVSVTTKAFNKETEEEEREWIVEMKIKTTRSKLRDIELFLQDSIEKMI
jgi:hypothetical protein